MFFVLSGFLITDILLDTQRCQNYLSGFYARRFLRTFPLYYGLLLVAFVVLPLLRLTPPSESGYGAHQIWFWLYLSNWTGPMGIGDDMFPHLWSLAVEEQFYLVWPFLLMWTTPRRCFQLCIAIAVLAFAARCLMVWQGVAAGAIYQFTVSRMDALALGGAVAAAWRMPDWHKWLVSRNSRIAYAAVLLGVAGALTSHGYSTVRVEGQLWGYTVVALVFALLLCCTLVDEARPSSFVVRLLRLPALRSIGKVSYAMYIFHKPLHDYLGVHLLARLGWPMSTSITYNLIYIAGGSAVLWLLGFVSYHAFEKFFLRMKPAYLQPAAVT
jgi:peptidoglycan/LPS O-acetylase OafA/YrhL